MVIYEVNITINEAVFVKFQTWLSQHIQLILQQSQFYSATVYGSENTTAPSKQLIVHYRAHKLADVNHYLENLAPAMRQEGLSQFGDHIEITRRILLEQNQW